MVYLNAVYTMSLKPVEEEESNEIFLYHLPDGVAVDCERLSKGKSFTIYNGLYIKTILYI